MGDGRWTNDGNDENDGNDYGGHPEVPEAQATGAERIAVPARQFTRLRRNDVRSRQGKRSFRCPRLRSDTSG